MNNTRPFSVAISVYCRDDAVCFDRALSSITDEQTIKPDEIVLVCDGPLNSELDAVINRYDRKYDIFRVIRLESNGGLGKALRIAVENSSNGLIARMDSDDVSLPDRFEQQLKFFEKHPETDIVGGDITEFIGKENNIVGKRKVPILDSDIKEYMKRRCPMNHMSVMFKKEAVEKAGNYQDWFWNEDYYLWLRMLLKASVFANTGTVLVNVRVGEEMYQRRGGKKYFDSEKKIQRFMLDNGVINYPTYLANVSERFIVQLLLSNKIRSWVYQKFARSY